jgi:D-glycero-beta-D-manno-heptose 1-phosphate adenylyltransferase
MKTPDPRTKIVSMEKLLALRAEWRRQGRTLVWTNGCFDVVHVGHIRNLHAAAQQGDVLVVGINSDASVRRIKGPTRPVIPHDERAELLASLACVDYVLVFADDTVIPVLSRLQPEIHCKGAEYAPPNGKFVPEVDTVRAYGGEIRYMPQIPNRSTSELIQRIGTTGEVSGRQLSVTSKQ